MTDLTPMNAAEATLATYRREMGAEILNGFANECFNSFESDIDQDGTLYISSPQSGHYADLDTTVEFVDWVADQE